MKEPEMHVVSFPWRRDRFIDESMQAKTRQSDEKRRLSNSMTATLLYYVELVLIAYCLHKILQNSASSAATEHLNTVIAALWFAGSFGFCVLFSLRGISLYERIKAYRQASNEVQWLGFVATEDVEKYIENNRVSDEAMAYIKAVGEIDSRPLTWREWQMCKQGKVDERGLLE